MAAIQEIYIKLIVGFPNDPKVRALAQYGEDAGLARDLYVQMCLYCKDTLSDGHVPAYQVPLLVYPASPERGNQFAKQLASVGLINEVADGWQVAAFLKRNRSKAEVEELSQIRSASGSKGGRPPGKSAGQRSRNPNGNQSAFDLGTNGEANDNPETETETETKSKTTPAVGGSAVAKSQVADGPAVGASQSATPKRGTRIPANFTVLPVWAAWARTNTPHVDIDRETEKFKNYWQAKAGKDATKIDWYATWRNWMLSAAERTPTASAANGARPPAASDKIASLQALKDDPPPATPPNVIQGSVL